MLLPPGEGRAGRTHQQKETPGCCQLLSSQDSHASCFSLAQKQKGGGGRGGPLCMQKRGASSRLKPRRGAKPAGQEPGYRDCKSAGWRGGVKWGGWGGSARSAHLLLASLLLQGESSRPPGPVLKARPQSRFKGPGAPWGPRGGGLEPGGELRCGESPSSSSPPLADSRHLCAHCCKLVRAARSRHRAWGRAPRPASRYHQAAQCLAFPS